MIKEEQHKGRKVQSPARFKFPKDSLLSLVGAEVRKPDWPRFAVQVQRYPGIYAFIQGW